VFPPYSLDLKCAKIVLELSGVVWRIGLLRAFEDLKPVDHFGNASTIVLYSVL